MKTSRKCRKGLVWALALVMLAASGAMATSIPVANYSFEAPGTTRYTEGVVDYWVATPALETGVQRPQDYFVITGYDLEQVAWIHTGSISQVLTGTTIQAGLTYELGALVGTWETSGTAPTYHVQLVDNNNSVVLSEVTGQPSLTSNQLVQVSTSYLANNSLYYGHTLKIVLSSGVDPDQEINFDKVTLNAVPIPAPVLLFGSGLLGLAGLGYRRRKQ